MSPERIYKPGILGLHMCLWGCVLMQLCQLHFPKPNVSLGLASFKRSGEDEVDQISCVHVQIQI